MALNNTTADACANAISAALGIADAPSQQKMRDQWRIIYAKLKADITIQIAASSIVTTGTAATQTGPAAPIPLNPL